MGLETVAQLVAEHSSTPREKAKVVVTTDLERELVQKMFSWITAGMIILGIGVAMLVVNKNFDIGKWFSMLASVLLLGGVGVASVGVLKALRQGANLSGKKPTGEIAGAVDTKSLPTKPIPGALPSITERTTQLIPADEARTNNVIGSKPRE